MVEPLFLLCPRHWTPGRCSASMWNATGRAPVRAVVRRTTTMRPSELVRAACEGNAKLALAATKVGVNVNARYRGRLILFWAIQ